MLRNLYSVQYNKYGRDTKIFWVISIDLTWMLNAHCPLLVADEIACLHIMKAIIQLGDFCVIVDGIILEYNNNIII